MRLKRLRIDSFKRFRQPLEITGLTDGLNLFAAPNESGKSTVAEAIRAAFLERHRSSVVDHLRPWGEGSSTPTVELEFSLGDKDCKLTKAFLGKKRCDLVIDGRAMSGTEAEDYLAELLGFKFAKKGASGAEDMGIPGLLWIQQGTAHQLAERVAHAGEHLRMALGESVGELAASQGDTVLRQVEAARNALLHATTGAPKGEFAAAIKVRDELSAEVARLEGEIAAYRDEVDRLTSLRAQHAAAAQAKPWERLGEQLKAAQHALAEAEGLAARKADADQRLKQAKAQVEAQRQRLAGFRKDEEAVEQRGRQLADAEAKAVEAQAEVQSWEQRHAQAVAADQQARDVLALVRKAADRAAKAHAVEAAARAAAAANEALELARKAQASLTELEHRAASLRIDPAALQRLRQTEDALRKAQARVESASTLVEFELRGDATLNVDGQPIVGRTTRTLVARARIDLPGLGSIEVVPGGADLDALVAARDSHQAALRAQLQVLNAASVADAEQRAREFDQTAALVKAQQDVVRAYAPQGVQALEAAASRSQAQLTAARNVVEAMPPDDDSQAPLPSLESAEAAEATARRALASVAESLHAVRLTANTADAARSSALAELQSARARTQAPEWAENQAQATIALAEASTQETAAQEMVAVLASQLSSLNIELLQQDVKRLGESLQHQLGAHAELATAITKLTARLETTGSLGLEELAAHKRCELEEAQRRAADLARRAKALDHLLTLLRDKRAALVKRLHAPLHKHLDRYLRILFPGAKVDVSEGLAPDSLTRVGADGSETGSLTLSAWARASRWASLPAWPTRTCSRKPASRRWSSWTMPW